jgi:hypothetical protein
LLSSLLLTFPDFHINKMKMIIFSVYSDYFWLRDFTLCLFLNKKISNRK